MFSICIWHGYGLEDSFTDVARVIFGRLAPQLLLLSEKHIRVISKLVKDRLLLMRHLLRFKQLIKLIVEFYYVTVTVLR